MALHEVGHMQYVPQHGALAVGHQVFKRYIRDFKVPEDLNAIGGRFQPSEFAFDVAESRAEGKRPNGQGHRADPLRLRHAGN